MKIDQLIKKSQKSILTNDLLNEVRGGARTITTMCVKDELSDSNGDGTADDCNMHVDDGNDIIVASR